jgi:hypothetical protein
VPLTRMRPDQLEALDQTARMEVVTIGSCGAGYRDPEGRAIGLRSELVARATQRTGRYRAAEGNGGSAGASGMHTRNST